MKDMKKGVRVSGGNEGKKNYRGKEKKERKDSREMEGKEQRREGRTEEGRTGERTDHVKNELKSGIYGKYYLLALFLELSKFIQAQ